MARDKQVWTGVGRVWARDKRGIGKFLQREKGIRMPRQVPEKGWNPTFRRVWP